jgi:hypothetical protein
MKEMTAKYGLDGNPPRDPGRASFLTDAWDTLMAYVMTVLLAGLKIALFLLLWGLLILALPTIIQYL